MAFRLAASMITFAAAGALALPAWIGAEEAELTKADVLERMVERYGAVDYYHAEVRGSSVNDEGVMDEMIGEFPATLGFRREDGQLRVAEEELEVIVSGQDLHMVLHGDRVRARFDAPERLTRFGVSSAHLILGPVVGSHAVIDALTGDLDPEGITVDFEDGHALLRYEAPDPIKLVVNPETGAIVESRVNFGRDTWVRWLFDAEDFERELEDEYFESEGVQAFTDVTQLLMQMAGQYNTEMIDKPAPGFQATTLDGEEIALEDYQGKVVVMEFWATWCPPCVESLPILQSAKEELGDESGVAFLGMNLDQGPEETRNNMVRGFMERHGFDFPQVMVDSPTAAAYNVGPIPMLMILRPDGTVKDVHLGVLRKDDLLARIEAAAETTDEADGG